MVMYDEWTGGWMCKVYKDRRAGMLKIRIIGKHRISTGLGLGKLVRTTGCQNVSPVIHVNGRRPVGGRDSGKG